MSFGLCFQHYRAAKAAPGGEGSFIIDSENRRFNWPFLLRFLKLASTGAAVRYAICSHVVFLSLQCTDTYGNHQKYVELSRDHLLVRAPVQKLRELFKYWYCLMFHGDGNPLRRKRQAPRNCYLLTFCETAILCNLVSFLLLEWRTSEVVPGEVQQKPLAHQI